MAGRLRRRGPRPAGRAGAGPRHPRRGGPPAGPAPLRAAGPRAGDPGGGDAFELAGALAHLTYARRFLVEAHDHYATAVRLAPDDVAAADALTNAADAYLAELRGAEAFALLRESSERAARAGDSA